MPRCAVEVQAHVVWLYLRFTLSYRIGRKRFFRKLCENAPRGRGTDGGEQLQYPETGNRVARVLCPAQDRQHVLDMAGLEKSEAAIFDEGILRRPSSISRRSL